MLALLAPVLAGRRFAAPYFAVMSLVVFTLSLGETPLHQLFYLIPRYQDVHEHFPPQVNAVVMIGPAILSAATVETIASWRGRRRILPFIVVPLLFVVTVAVHLARHDRPVDWPPLVAATIVTALIALAVTAPPASRLWRSRSGLAKVVPAVILAVAFVQPTGVEIIGSVTGRPLDPAWEPFWKPDPARDQAIEVNLSHTDPEGAGGFLQDQRATSDPFRYVGYGGLGHPAYVSGSYEDRRSDPSIQALLVSGRPIFLDLYSLQGFNPNQLTRYAEFLEAVNGRPQDYHVANVLPTGLASPLLMLLNTRYVLVDATLPPDREDVASLQEDRQEVFRTDDVIVFEEPSGLPHAWIVHDVRAVERGQALALWMRGDIDLRHTALVEGAVPRVEEAANPTGDRAEIVRYEPDLIQVRATTEAPGLLVLSEVYESGWQAYIEDEPVDILPTNHVLRGIPLPAGEHTVELRYEPVALRLGVLISALTVLAMVVTLAIVGWSMIRR